MKHFIVVGVGPQSPEPVEHVATTASDAALQYSRLRRVCGKAGRVDVWTKNGRKIDPRRLESLVRTEKSTLSTP